MVRVASARWLVAVLVTVTVTGCGDGDLVRNWAALPTPEPRIPVVGCYDAPIRTTVDINTIPTPPTPCEQAHTVEAFHVGRFPVAGTAPPAEGTADYWTAFDECERLSVDFLGGRWYDTRVDLAITVPSPSQWDGGGRWYRCDLMETSTSLYLLTRRTGTLRGAARPDSPLVERCVTLAGPRDSGWEYVTPIACDVPHDAEYAGAFKADGTEYPPHPVRAALYERCRDVVAQYVGGTREGVQLGYLAFLASQRAWSRGDRQVRCYAWRENSKLTGTVKGLGNGPPR